MARIAFFHKDLYERLGVMSISANLKTHGHASAVFCGDGEKNIVNSILDFEPDIVASGPSTLEQGYSLEVMAEIKQRRKRIITLVGAHHATIYPEETINNPQVDAICLGEGELTVLELMNTIDASGDYLGIAGLWGKQKDKIIRNPLRNLIKDLDTLPFPDREIYYSRYEVLARKPTKSFIVSKGCPFQCSFCFNHYYQKMFVMSKPFVRLRRPENVFAEILNVKERYNFDWAQFHDSTFNFNLEYNRNFLSRYKQHNLPGFLCNIRADLLTAEGARLLKDAGCDRVTMGIENGNEAIRRTIINKGGTNEQILQAARLLKTYGIRMSISNIIGLPGETIENAFETIELNRRMDPEYCTCHVLMPFPKTEIAQYCIDRGYLDKDFRFESVISKNQSCLKQKNIKQLVNLQKFFYFAVKYPKLRPLIKILIKLPPNRFFNMIKNLPVLCRSLRYENRLSVKLLLLRKWFQSVDL